MCFVEIVGYGVIVGDAPDSGWALAFAPARFELVKGLDSRGNKVQALNFF